MHLFTCFSLGDFIVSITAQKQFGLGEIRKGLIIYDDLFIFHMVHQ